MPGSATRYVVLVMISLISAGSAPAQETTPLGLKQAVSIALEKNPLRKAALADTRVALAEVSEARSSLLPHLTFSETATRGNDPVYVFGSKLRQQRFSSGDFALNLLNTPTPFGNFTTRLGGTWNLFDSFASWRNLKRSRLMNEGTTHQLDRTDQEIMFRVISAYYAVLWAGKQVEVAEQAASTAQAIVEHSQARYDSGVIVEADLLSAKVRGASRQKTVLSRIAVPVLYYLSQKRKRTETSAPAAMAEVAN